MARTISITDHSAELTITAVVEDGRIVSVSLTAKAGNHRGIRAQDVALIDAAGLFRLCSSVPMDRSPQVAAVVDDIDGWKPVVLPSAEEYAEVYKRLNGKLKDIATHYRLADTKPLYALNGKARRAGLLPPSTYHKAG